LTHVSCDPDDLEAITPNHILIGKQSNARAIGNFDDMDLIARKMWRKAERLTDVFWNRWSKEYLPTLLNRPKWHKSSKPVEVGDVVLIVDLNAPRGSWPKGIVREVFPGKDGQVRVVEVQTAKGILKRPVVKVAVLDVKRGTPAAHGDEDPAQEVVMTVITRAAAKKLGAAKTISDKKTTPARLELPLPMAKHLDMLTIRQEVAELKKTGWYRKMKMQYLDEFKAKRKKAGHKE